MEVRSNRDNQGRAERGYFISTRVGRIVFDKVFRVMMREYTESINFEFI